jgi:hypothetical protein
MVYVERRKGKDSFRMLADVILELHEMADFIGIPRSRFKASPPAIVPHYLLPAPAAKKALKAGAVEPRGGKNGKALRACRRKYRQKTAARIVAKRGE